MNYTIFDGLALSDLHFEPDHPKPFRLFAAVENPLTRNGALCVLHLVMTPCQSTVALQIDTEGRAWKIAAKCNDNGRLEGVELSLLDNETNWQYVPAQVSNGETHWAQKGGNLIRLTAKTENNVLNISWTEFGENPNGKLIGAFDSNLFFAPVSIAVDTTISGGEYSVV